MGKDKADNIPIPPDGGVWTFEMVTGFKVTGQVMAIHDNATEIIADTDTGKKVGMVLLKEHIIVCWTSAEAEVKET